LSTCDQRRRGGRDSCRSSPEEFPLRVTERACAGATALALLVSDEPSRQPRPPSTGDSQSGSEARGVLQPRQSEARRQFALARFLRDVQIGYDDNEVVHAPLYLRGTMHEGQREFPHGHEIHT
jgi:hypothetical protein